ncbi:hypothetical protein M409DRAFT_59677 [Zasmidium cellare ATCC 36951]|uniref:Uncharacterized protein n=1 Tax=Zasmidium cellare ATCC 36951 TaxID=1080233 RepID=A0A6A6C1G2_ZASCE|nr:uncharacterized protein M409DRAFT_59677 [Zasmidium cellare ATCC 36951]KAF2160897.1 hypothetical protein M409DRAFT_59677 [Zasmidium cellare ATCC 36951]
MERDHESRSPDLRVLLTRVLDHLGYNQSWGTFLPPRVGGRGHIDAAACKLVTAYNRKYCQSSASQAVSYEPSYYKTNDTAASADERLVVQALQAITDAIQAESDTAASRNAQDLAEAVISRPLLLRCDDFSCAILFTLLDQSFKIPCAKGLPSPFEDPAFFYLQPV